MTKVVVNGTFDIIHLGHLRLLDYARSLPNSYVLVLADSDRRIKQLKGNDRPINNEYERCSLLFALKSVDRVETFDSDEELIKLIKDFEPDVMVKGSDYRGKPIIGAEYCKEIKFYDRLGNYSTTNKIQDIAHRR
jgi:D-beta-D-heptose 7-phosphate kinase/D-beta-D-heptose 1-phosphate adenosyltransferase